MYPRTTNNILESYLISKGIPKEDIFVNYTPFGHSDWSKIVGDVVAVVTQEAARGACTYADRWLEFRQAYLRVPGVQAAVLLDGFTETFGIGEDVKLIWLRALDKLDLERIYRRYGFPNDMLVHLNVVSASVRDVPSRPVPGEVEQLHQFGFGTVGEIATCPKRADDGRAEQERDTDRGEMAVRCGVIGLVQAVGVDEGECGRQLGGAFMVIDDNHVEWALGQLLGG